MSTKWVDVTNLGQIFIPGAFLRWKGHKSEAWEYGITAAGSRSGELRLKNTIDGPVVRWMLYAAWPIWQVLEVQAEGIRA